MVSWRDTTMKSYTVDGAEIPVWLHVLVMTARTDQYR